MSEQNPMVTANTENEEISLLDILQVIADNLRLLIFGPILAVLFALGLAFVIKPTFTATTVFLPPQQQQSAALALLQTFSALGSVGGGVPGLRNPGDQFVALTGSRSIRDSIIERFDLQKRYEMNLKDDARKHLRENTRITAGRDGLIRLEVDDHDPKLAADIANAYVEELSKLMGRLALTEAQQRRELFEGQLKKAQEGLSKAENALKATGISGSALKVSPSTAVASVASLMAQIAAKEVQLGSMRNYLSETAPDFVRIQSELTALRAQLAKAEKDNANSGNGSDYVSKFREFKYYETLFELMAKQYEIARIDESREGAVIQVVDMALPPERKSRPNRALIASYTFIAVAVLLLLFIFIRKALFNSLKQPEQASKLNLIKSSARKAFWR